MEQWRGRVKLNIGQEAIFFLQRDKSGDFYLQIPFSEPVGKGDLDFEPQIKIARRFAAVFADPARSLNGKDENDRRFAAIALVERHQSGAFLRGSAQPISADENRLILQTLARIKWSDPPLNPEGDMSLRSAFGRLRLSKADGWEPPQPRPNEKAEDVFERAVSKWFNDYGGQYRIKRLAPAPSEVR